MSKDNNFTFWEDSWNYSKEGVKESEECCGEWDSEGKCTCKNK